MAGLGDKRVSTSLRVYIAGYVVACLVAVVLAYRERQRLDLLKRDYWRFLAEPWKLVTFALSGGCLTLIAPWSGDFSWDYVDSLSMSVLTFTTAPWCAGVLFRALRRERPFVHAYIAVCTGLFSASWSYDLYILFRDGFYPPTWQANLPLSGAIYILAGLFWSLEWREGTGVTFSFMWDEWPCRTASKKLGRLVFWMVLLGLPVLFGFGMVVYALGFSRLWP